MSMTAREAIERLGACATAEDVVNLAGEAGVELDSATAQALLEKKGELADAQLAGVSGGFLGAAPMSADADAEVSAEPNFLSTDATSLLDGSASNFFEAAPTFLFI